MKMTVELSDFEQAFKDYNREDNFSREGLRALFEYLEDWEQSTGEEIELDVIALCGDYTEYKNLKELKQSYDQVKNLEDLQDQTQVIEFDGPNGEKSLIIQDF